MRQIAFVKAPAATVGSLGAFGSIVGQWARLLCCQAGPAAAEFGKKLGDWLGQFGACTKLSVKPAPGRHAWHAVAQWPHDLVVPQPASRRPFVTGGVPWHSR